MKERDKKCVQCGTTLNLTCGHLITRSKYSVRWTLLNCHCQCRNCNFKHEFQPEHFQLWFINKFGLKKYKDLVAQSNQIKHYSRTELFNLLKQLKHET